jgi:hypothetical protein
MFGMDKKMLSKIIQIKRKRHIFMKGRSQTDTRRWRRGEIL